MGKRVLHYLLLSQLSFFGFLGICVAVIPHFLFERHEVGVSNYGVNGDTVVPYTLGFLLCAICILRAGHITPRQPPRLELFRKALFVLGTLFVVVLASTYPYKIDAVLTDLHIAIGALLIIFELVMSLWLTSGLPRRWVDVMVLALQASGCLLALLTLVGVLHLLMLAQLIATGAFGVLLVRVGPRLVQHHVFDEMVP